MSVAESQLVCSDNTHSSTSCNSELRMATHMAEKQERTHANAQPDGSFRVDLLPL